MLRREPVEYTRCADRAVAGEDRDVRLGIACTNDPPSRLELPHPAPALFTSQIGRHPAIFASGPAGRCRERSVSRQYGGELGNAVLPTLGRSAIPANGRAGRATVRPHGRARRLRRSADLAPRGFVRVPRLPAAPVPDRVIPGFARTPSALLEGAPNPPVRARETPRTLAAAS